MNRLDDLRSGLLNFDFASQSGDADIDTSSEEIPVAVARKARQLIAVQQLLSR